MKDYTKRDLIDVLLALDEEVALGLGTAEEADGWYQLVFIGGSGLLLGNLTTRTVTRDIDTFSIPHELQPYTDNYELINNRAAIFEYAIPYNYPDRLIELDLPTKAIKFFRPSNEDLAVMKLYALRDHDLDDLHSPQFVRELDWNLMDYLVYDKDEAQASALSEHGYRMMKNAYEKYAKQYGHTPNPEGVFAHGAKTIDGTRYPEFTQNDRGGRER